MKKLYRKAYSIIRYIQNEVEWCGNNKTVHHKEMDLATLPTIVVGAAFKSWIASNYALPSIPNVYLDIQTARKFRKKYKIVEVED